MGLEVTEYGWKDAVAQQNNHDKKLYTYLTDAT